MTKKRVAIVAATLLLLVLPISQVVGAGTVVSGKLVVPDHHQGVLGDNDIPVTATALQDGIQYLIKLQVSYHANPRTPPESGAEPPVGYVERKEFAADGETFAHTFVVPLPDCHWQITAMFTLYYSLDGGETWLWNWDEDATQGVDIWSDCTPPPPPQEGPGTGTPGYWMNHPLAWPVGSITVGGQPYARKDAIEMIKAPVKGNKVMTMFAALVAAKLNILVGNDDGCSADTVAAADAWMATNGDSTVKGNSTAWSEGEPLYWQLDAYNNGLLCAPARD
jgi:hypothetical protein